MYLKMYKFWRDSSKQGKANYFTYFMQILAMDWLQIFVCIHFNKNM